MMSIRRGVWDLTNMQDVPFRCAVRLAMLKERGGGEKVRERRRYENSGECRRKNNRVDILHPSIEDLERFNWTLHVIRIPTYLHLQLLQAYKAYKAIS